MQTENVFVSLINTQWSDERNKIKLDTLKNTVVVKFNFKEFSCSQFHIRYVEKNKDLLRMIGNAAKYNN